VLNKFLLFAFIFISVLLNSSAYAMDERFSVDINVDVTDANASAAREKAMSEANRAAVLAVAKRISTADGVTRINNLNENQLINFIKEVSVIEEKTSPVRYIAHLRIVLNEEMLKQYMKERDIPLLLTGNGKILVLPIFREFSSDKPLLWENSNPWKQAWDNAANTSAVTFVSIPANTFNSSAITAEQALALDGEALSKIMHTDNFSDAYVLDAIYDGIDGLIVRASSYNGDNQTIRVSGSRSSGAELFANAVETVKKQLEDYVSAQSISENSLENSIVVLYNFNRLSEWAAAEQALSNTPIINDVNVQAFANNKAQLKLTYVGSEDKLIKFLNSQAYTLHKRGDYYLLEKY